MICILTLLISAPFIKLSCLHIAELWSSYIKHLYSSKLYSQFHCPWKFYYRNPFGGLKWLIPRSLCTSAELVSLQTCGRFPLRHNDKRVVQSDRSTPRLPVERSHGRWWHLSSLQMLSNARRGKTCNQYSLTDDGSVRSGLKDMVALW